MEEVEWLLREQAARYGGRLAFKRVEESSEPEAGPSLDELGLDPRLVEALKSRGVARLYRFQAEAVRLILGGVDTVIVAGTGTGKTEAFLIPVLEKSLRSGGRPVGMLVYPTKALARDQLARIRGYVESLGLRVEVYDGDTPEAERRRILSDPPHIIVSNPDMIHYSLAFSRDFRDLVRSLSIIVFDELHTYSGVFGSHVRWVVQRLLRYSGDSVLVGAGATVGNPGAHGRNLFGREPAVVEGPRRRRGVAWHYFIDCGVASRWTVATAVVSALARSGLKTLVFVDSQQMAEVLARLVSKQGVRALVHRAGLPADYRAMVEKSLREGRVDAVVATPTLELGIDIGVLDATVNAWLPSNYASYIQRAGRVGRRGRTGVVVTIMGDNPIESYFLKRPEEYFSQEVPPVFTEPGNPEVAKLHLAALLLEAGALRLSDIPEYAEQALRSLRDLGLVTIRKNVVLGDRSALSAFLRKSPGLRSTGSVVSIVDERGKVIGYREMPQALYELHPGAVYYHMGRQYFSMSLDLDTMTARVWSPPHEIPYYTKALHTSLAEPLSVEDSRTLGSIRVYYGVVRIETIISGYVVKEETSGETISEVVFEKPLRWSYVTKGVYAGFPSLDMHPEAAASSFHALEHVLISAGKPVAGYDDADVGGVSYSTGLIVLYDASPGGNGATRLVFQRLERVAEIARRILSECSCASDGCPRCVYSPFCGNNNAFLSRTGALRVLEAVLRGEARVAEVRPSGTPLA